MSEMAIVADDQEELSRLASQTVSAMSEQEKPSLDDNEGNCKQCGHPFDPHLVIAYDTKDLSKGGEMRCPVEGCTCFHGLDFDFQPPP